VQRQAIEYKLPLAKAKEAIKEFNSEYETMVSDYLVYQHFLKIKHAFDPEIVGAGAILLDKLWNTNIQYSGDMKKICRALGEKCSFIEGELKKLNENDLKDHPENIMDVVRKVFPVILNGKKKRHYSFTTKFFHWCSPQHFPMVDLKARKAIRRFQKKSSVPKNLTVKSSPDYSNYLDDYEDWVYFYSNLLRGISEDDEELLKQADRKSKYPGLVVQHSLLRILDKVFWIWGYNQQ